jgi:predicted metal-dependent hydrolase
MTARGESPRDEDEEDEETAAGFDAAVALFNRGDFHACHDVVEELWYSADDPARTLLHGVLQCAVGFHHLFNQVPTHLLQTFVLLLKES